MIVPMPSLTRAKNGDWFARKAIPSEVRERYAAAHRVKREELFRWPAGTPLAEAKRAYCEWLERVEGQIAAARDAANGRAVSMSQRDLHELAGRWYVWFVQQHEDDPGGVEAWDDLHDRYRDVVMDQGGVGHPDEDIDQPVTPGHRRRIRAKLTELSQLLTFLCACGTNLTREAQEALLDGPLAVEFVAALALLRRRAEGDYSADQRPQRFPTPVETTRGTPAGWTPWQAFEEWVRANSPQASTVNRWRAVFLDLERRFHGKDIAAFTGEDACDWRDALLAEGKSRRVVREVWLTAARAVFNWLKDEKKRITHNPFLEAKLRKPKVTRTRDRDFTEEEIAAILGATLRPMSPRINPNLRNAYRWVPWLCAYTGARSGEITQLRKQDVQQHRGGFWTINISPEAGAVKGQIARRVPLHAHLVEQGFIAFVTSRPDGPLFYDQQRRDGAADDPTNPKRPPYVLLRQKVAAWVRDIGVTDKAISPNHAWRHTFKGRAAFPGKIDERLRDAICGHTPRHVGSDYELPKIEELAEAMARFPRYEVGGD